MHTRCSDPMSVVRRKKPTTTHEVKQKGSLKTAAHVLEVAKGCGALGQHNKPGSNGLPHVFKHVCKISL